MINTTTIQQQITHFEGELSKLKPVVDFLYQMRIMQLLEIYYKLRMKNKNHFVIGVESMINFTYY